MQDYIKRHIQVCTATKRVGIPLRAARIKCAKSHYSFQRKRGYALDPNKSFRD